MEQYDSAMSSFSQGEIPQNGSNHLISQEQTDYLHSQSTYYWGSPERELDTVPYYSTGLMDIGQHIIQYSSEEVSCDVLASTLKDSQQLHKQRLWDLRQGQAFPVENRASCSSSSCQMLENATIKELPNNTWNMERLAVGNGRPKGHRPEISDSELTRIPEIQQNLLCGEALFETKDGLSNKKNVTTGTTVGTQTDSRFINEVPWFCLAEDQSGLISQADPSNGTYQIWFVPGVNSDPSNPTTLERGPMTGAGSIDGDYELPSSYSGLRQGDSLNSSYESEYGSHPRAKTSDLEVMPYTISDNSRNTGNYSRDCYNGFQRQVASPVQIRGNRYALPSEYDSYKQQKTSFEKRNFERFAANAIQDDLGKRIPTTGPNNIPDILRSIRWDSVLIPLRSRISRPDNRDESGVGNWFTRSDRMVVKEKPIYSAKIFVSGLSFTSTKQDLYRGFDDFGVVDVSWCYRHNDDSRVNGCAYVTLASKNQVSRLVRSCVPRESENIHWKMQRTWFYLMPCIKYTKKVELTFWDLRQNSFYSSYIHKTLGVNENTRSVFVGNIHGRLTAIDLAVGFRSQGFADIAAVKMGTDKYGYPAGFAKVTFFSVTSFLRAVKLRRLNIALPDLGRSFQIDPFIDHNTHCFNCNNPANAFCRNDDCYKYYCQMCFCATHLKGRKHNYHALENVVVRGRRLKGIEGHP